MTLIAHEYFISPSVIIYLLKLSFEFQGMGVGGLTSFFSPISNNQYYTTIKYLTVYSTQNLIIGSSIDLKKIVNSIFICLLLNIFIY